MGEPALDRLQAVAGPLEHGLARFSAASSRVKVPSLQHPARARFVRALPLLLAVSIYYVFLASSGHFVDLTQSNTNYHDRLAQGFRAGQLHLVEPPHPALAKQANPFANRHFPLWLWDASLHDGHYYLYFGPVPALLLALARTVSGYEGTISDQWPTVLFLLGRFWAGAALILGLAHRSKVPPPTWLGYLCVAVFGLVYPIPYVSVRPAVWEASLAGGQCFLFVGLWLSLAAFSSTSFRRSLLVLAGTSFGLAVGCRATAAISGPLLILASFVFSWRWRRELSAWAVDGLALGVPFAGLCVLHGYYNWARFGSPLEFGVRFQTTLQTYHTSSSYVVPNLYSYVFTVPDLSCRFPFIGWADGREIPALLGGPPLGYATFVPLAGIFFLVPWLLLIPAGLLTLLRRPPRRGRPRASHSLSALEVWAALSAVSVALSMVPALRLFVAGPRYLGDALGGLVLLGAVVSWGAWRTLAQSRAGRWGLGLGVPLLGGLTCLAGVLTPFAESNGTFQKHNPFVYQRLETALSLCPPPAKGANAR